ncbi:MAG: hypothetical protein ACTHMG_09460 [Sphingomonas sp.]
MIDLFAIDIGSIVDLATRVATAGAIRLGEAVAADDVFEHVIGVAVVVYAQG